MNSRHRGGVNLSPRWHEDVTAVTGKRHRGDSCFLILRFKVDFILDCDFQATSPVGSPASWRGTLCRRCGCR